MSRSSRTPEPRAVPVEAQSGGRARVGFALLLVLLVLVAVVRWHRLGVPLERDEGEYAYAGQLLLQGVPPYGEVYNMKLPGIYVCYASILAVFGQTIAGIRLGLLLVNLASIALVFALGRKLLDPLAGLSAAAVFAVLSLDRSVSGLFANSEHFVLLPMLAGAWLTLAAAERPSARRLCAAGFLMGVAFTIKQHGIAFVALGALALAAAFLRERPAPWRRVAARLGWYALGAAVPFAAICAWMQAAGVFKSFWFWTFTYAREYVSQVGWSQGAKLFAAQAKAMGGPLLGIWLLAAVGLTALLWDEKARARWSFLALLALGSLAAVCPGLLFRDHYFLFVLPAASLLAGAGLSALARLASSTFSPRAGGILASALLFGALAVPIAARWDVLVRASDDEVARAVYGLNPFPESLPIADYLRRNTSPSDRIAVLGSEPQLYFYSGRRGATSYIYTYALMEDQPFALEMQREMIRQIEERKPKYIVYANVKTSWLAKQKSPQELFLWMQQYLGSAYEQTGAVELRPEGSVYTWDEQMASWKGRNWPHWVGVFRRKASG